MSKYSPCMIRAIISDITDNRDTIGTFLDDNEVDTILSLLSDCMNKRDRTVASWKLVPRGNISMLACSKCKNIIGYRPTPYCPSCGAIMQDLNGGKNDKR
jgi:hypothetical protein